MNLTSHEIPLKLNDLPFRITWESSFSKKGMRRNSRRKIVVKTRLVPNAFLDKWPEIYLSKCTASAVHILKLERYRED